MGRGRILLGVAAAVAIGAFAAPAPAQAPGRFGLVAFVRNSDPPTGGSRVELLDVASGAVRELVHAAGDVQRVTISPDGRSVAYDVDLGHGGEIRVIGTDGQGDRGVAGGDGLAYGPPAWTPDGARLVYSRAERRAGSNKLVDGSGEIYSIAADGSDERRLTTDHRDDDGPAPSPDAIHIVFSRQAPAGRARNADLWIMRTDGTHQRRLTGDPADEISPVVSPDGRLIAFERCACNLLRPGRAVPRRLSSLQVVRIDGRARRTLARSAGNDYDAAWSPDSVRIAFTSDRADRVRSGDYYRDQLYVADLEGGAVHHLLRSSEGDSAPSWSRAPA